MVELLCAVIETRILIVQNRLFGCQVRHQTDSKPFGIHIFEIENVFRY